jgi:predicted unusual protein kinase regulating ubiquinone biosynthesis (AarF/ABC1/UbiB family)
MSAASHDLLSRPSAPSAAPSTVALQLENPMLDATEARPITVAAAPARSGAPKSLEDILVYDPEAIAAFYKRRPFQILFRLISIFGIALGYALGLLWDKVTGRQKINEQKRATGLRNMLTRLGPAYIKVGQALSTRPDLVSPATMAEMVKLQDQLPAFSNEIAMRFIAEEIGQPPEDVYDYLSPSPIAAASLGQVYKGRLKSGEEVAVKVQRPGLADQITKDIYIIRILASWAKRNFKIIRSDLVSIVDEFGTRIFEEMDYTHEGENAERFAALYGYLPEILVPCIYPQFTGRRVLTMEWIEGIKLTELEELKRRGINPTHVIEVGVQCSLRQLLEHGFFHADPHPGNLLVTADGKLAYLDFGMMCQVEPYQRYGLIEAIVHMVNRDFSALAQDYVNLEFLTPETDLSPIIPALANVFNNALGASVAELNLKSITDEFSALMYEYPFRVPAYYALIIRSLVTLDGIAITVDPNFKVLSKAYPYVARRLLSDPAPQLRDSLQALLFQDGSFRWNRLENLLNNAKNSDHYDLNKVLDQTLDYLFSERGEFLRLRIADELAKELDRAGYGLLKQISRTLRLHNRETTPLTTSVGNAPSADTSSWQHALRVLGILRNTPGLDVTLLASVVPKILAKHEARDIGRRVVNGVAQRAIARMIREFLVSEPASTTAALPPTRAA